MNIFLLADHPVDAAQMQCNKHVVKMPTENAQILCSVFWQHNIPAPYKLTHNNHPCNIFARRSSANFDWVVTHGLALCYEYTYRYQKVRKSQAVIEWCQANKRLLSFSESDLTAFPIAIAEDKICRKHPDFNSADAVHKYRLFYIYDKPFAKWTKREAPMWFSGHNKMKFYD